MLKGLMPMTYRRPKSRIRSRTADSFHSRVPSPHPMRPSSVVSLTKRKFRHAVPVKKTSTFVIFMETLLPSTPSVQQPLFFSSRNHFPSVPATTFLQNVTLSLSFRELVTFLIFSCFLHT